MTIIPKLITGCLCLLLVVAAWCGINVYHYADERAAIMQDHSVVNSITHGLFSANEWKGELKTIVSDQIQDFEFSEQQDSLMRVQIASILHDVISKAKHQINSEDQKLKNKLRKWGVNAVIDWEDIRKEVPAYSRTIMDNLKQKKSKARIQQLLNEKIDELAATTYDDSDSILLNKIYNQYKVANKDDFNNITSEQAALYKQTNYRYAWAMVGIVCLFLVSWLVAKQYSALRKPFLILSVILGAIVLATSLASPMIEIDARIQQFDFQLLGEHILFEDQVLFFRSKSILEVVSLLVQSPRFDSFLVGVLILAFSVILPVTKLTANGAYLFSSPGIRRNKIVQWFAFKSGKWSMADVMVVAIFMAYVGFDGMIDNQIQQVEYESQMLSSVATNDTSLLAAFFLFLSFVLYSLILSEILTWLAKQETVHSE